MRILITGGTGFIGRALCSSLNSCGHQLTVLTRNPDAALALRGQNIQSLATLDEWGADEVYDAVINLSGEPIMAERWSHARKQVLLNSRVGVTSSLIKAIDRVKIKPSVLISGSAIGYYGDQGDQVLREDSPAGTGFAHELCAAWEQAALEAERSGVRVCLVRTGLVLGKGGGFLQEMLPSFRLGLGGALGAGEQWMSWIHLEDEIGILRFLLENSKARGVFNATAPHPVINLDFTRMLARQLRRPAFLSLPSWLLQLGFGERAGLLLGSQRVLPHRIEELGYKFRFETLCDALPDVLGA